MKRSLLVGCVVVSALLGVAPVFAEEEAWRVVEPDNILLVTTDRGDFLVELTADFAPKHAAHVKKMTREGFYNNRPFYRVIENFVAQTGSGDDMAPEGNKRIELFVGAEFSRPITSELDFTPTGHGDAYAEETGFSKGFPVARSIEEQKAWIAHCPGVVGMARNDDPGSGGTDWYVVTGQAPRHLDRNISVFGRIIDGLEIVQAMPHGFFPAEGQAGSTTKGGKIEKVMVVSDLPESKRPLIWIENTSSPDFASRLEQRKKRTASWYAHRPPAFVDVCTVNIALKIDWPEE